LGASESSIPSVISEPGP